MKTRDLIIAIIGFVLLIIGFIILAIEPVASTRFFVGGLISWLGIIFLWKTLTRKQFSK